MPYTGSIFPGEKLLSVDMAVFFLGKNCCLSVGDASTTVLLYQFQPAAETTEKSHLLNASR